MNTEQIVRDVLKALDSHLNVLLYGPPGTGKTYLMTKIKEAFMTPDAIFLREEADTDFFEERRNDRSCPAFWWVTFHQAYTYEDFVVGLRTKAGHVFHLEAHQGPLLEAAEHARLPDGRSLLLIDEVNRGNTARIFGEFITLMEGTKRLSRLGGTQPETVAVSIPHINAAGLTFGLKRPCEDQPRQVTVSTPFQMPWHVFTVATMNSVDKTVAPLDAALRRRFQIIELRPDYETLLESLQIHETITAFGDLPSTPADLGYWRKLAVLLLYKINARIRAIVGEDYELGHGYLWPLVRHDSIDDFRRGLADVLKGAIFPHVREILRTDPEALGAALSAAEPGTEPWYPAHYADPPDELSEFVTKRPIEVEDLRTDEIERVARRLAKLPPP